MSDGAMKDPGAVGMTAKEKALQDAISEAQTKGASPVLESLRV
jgi:hypothetical protein